MYVQLKWTGNINLFISYKKTAMDSQTFFVQEQEEK